MNSLRDPLLLVGRVLIALVFIYAGFGKFMAPGPQMGYMASVGLPGVLLWPAAVLELVGGLLVILGWHTRWLALALAAFSILSALFFHTNFADMMQLISFLKNLGLAGGFLVLAADGAGRYSLDARRG